MLLRRWLAHPLLGGRDVDDPKLADVRRAIIRGKPFLRRIYEDWYTGIRAVLPDGDGTVVELGSGAGFLRDSIPGLITSDVFACGGLTAVLDGQYLPFADGALHAIVMTDVLHHLPGCRRFFAEAARCVRPGGAVVMVEPWVSAWSRLIYGKLHHEPFRPEAEHWEFPMGGPQTAANGALPWIVFVRDRDRFEREFPEWEVRSITPGMPIRYLVSGGISMRTLAPTWTYDFWHRVEALLQPWMAHCGMFAQIVLVRACAAGEGDATNPRR